MKTKLLLLSVVFFTTVSFAQTYLEPLPNSPIAAWRHDDVWFLNEDLGWICNVDGEIWKTEDGGDSWDLQLSQATSFRCITFADEMHGWVGNLGPGNWAPTDDTNVIYQTSDGGETWTPIDNITGPVPAGICGIQAVNDQVIYAVGRWLGPAYFISSTDGGQSWTSVDMSDVCNELIDVNFFTPDSGFVAGGTGDGEATLYYTYNGGDSFEEYYAVDGDHFWKVEFNDEMFGYASIWEEYEPEASIYSVTMDGGETWTEQEYAPGYYYAEGIGFANDTLGWVGGEAGTQMTTDGGETWTSVIIDATHEDYINRFRFVNENCMYAVGSRVYKYTTETSTSVSETAEVDMKLSNFPNPFTDKTTITYSLDMDSHVELSVHDMGGRRIATLVDENQKAGEYEVAYELKQSGSDSFVCSLRTPAGKQVITLVKQR